MDQDKSEENTKVVAFQRNKKSTSDYMKKKKTSHSEMSIISSHWSS